MQSNGIKLVLLSLLLIVSMICSLMFGYKVFTVSDVFHALFQNQHIDDHNILMNLRLPRTLLAALIGLMLGISGVLIQTVTRNPFASPGIMVLIVVRVYSLLLQSSYLILMEHFN